MRERHMKLDYQRVAASAVAAIVVAMTSRSSLADAPPGRYTVSAGTVFDTMTGLTWQQTDSGGNYTFSGARTYCQGLGGWRVPSQNELMTIVDFARMSPSIDSVAFPGAAVAAYWSSTLLAGDSTRAWYVAFAFGSTSTAALATTNRVRCVR